MIRDFSVGEAPNAIKFYPHERLPMRTTKLRAPDGFSALSIEGRSVDVGKDGSYDADHRDVATLRAHGFTDWHDHPGEGGDIETMTKPQLVNAALAFARIEMEKRSVDDLRSALRGARAEPAEDEAPSDADLAAAEAKLEDGGPMTEQAIARMDRAELFAYLRSRGAAIGAATKTEGVRAAALAELRKG